MNIFKKTGRTPLGLILVGLVFNQNFFWITTASATPIAPQAPGGAPVRGISYSALPSSVDLGSTKFTTSAPNSQPVLMQVGASGPGRSTVLVRPGQQLTTSQFLAVSQLQGGGVQRLDVNLQGAAIGGFASIIAPTSSPIVLISSLAIPSRVSVASIGFTTANPFVVSGQTSIAGALFALQNNPGVTSQLNLGSLNIANGGLLTGDLPLNRNVFGNVFASRALVVNVAGDVNNKGTIGNSGDLTINAGGAINNTGALTKGLSGGTIAAQNIALSTGNGSLTNTGVISAHQNLSISSPTTGLTINADGGFFASRLGQIQVISGSPDSHGDLNVNKGDWNAAGGISYTAPCANIAVLANRLDGPVSLLGANAIAGASKGNVSIVSSKLSADPVYFAQGGDLDLGFLSFSSIPQPDGRSYNVYKTNGDDFVALASGNVGCFLCGSPGNAMIDASSTTGAGGKITIAAGVNFTVNGSTSPVSCTDCSSAFNILGPAGAGGGNVTFDSVALKTNGAPISVQSNGGISNFGTISILNVETSGAGGAGGTAASPSGVAGQSAGSITIIANGNSGSATVDIGAGSNIGFLRAYGGGGGGARSGSGSAAGGSGGNGGLITVLAPGTISVGGEINSSGGGAGGSDTTGAAPSGGNGGDINILSGIGTVTLSGPVLAAGGGGGGNASANGGGGGSFGGGGGGSTHSPGFQITDVGGAGGGIFGGGSGASGAGTAGGGGGFFGGGGLQPPNSAQVGTEGQGGGGANFGKFGVGADVSGKSASGGDIGVNGTTNGAGRNASAAGNGGSIVLSGTHFNGNSQGLEIGSRVNNFGGFSGAGFSNGVGPTASVYTTNGTLVISEPEFNSYSNSLDLSAASGSSSNNPISSMSFAVNHGTPASTSAAVGTLNAASITVNGHTSVNGGTSASYSMTSGTTISLLIDGSPQTVQQTDALTPAESVALIQVLTTNSQPLTLTTNSGNDPYPLSIANGGSFTISPANIPTGGFTDMTLPGSVAATLTSPRTAFSNFLTIGQALADTAHLIVAPLVPGAAGIDTPTLTLNGAGGTTIAFTSNFSSPAYGATPVSALLTRTSFGDLQINATEGVTYTVANQIAGGSFLISSGFGGINIGPGGGNGYTLSFTGGNLKLTPAANAISSISHGTVQTDGIFTYAGNNGDFSLSNGTISSTFAPSVPTDVIIISNSAFGQLDGTNGNFSTANDNAQIEITSPVGLDFNDQLSWNVTSTNNASFIITTPQIYFGGTVGLTGSASAILRADANASGSLLIAPDTQGAASTFTLGFTNGASVSSATSISLGDGANLVADGALNIQTPSLIAGISGDSNNVNVYVYSNNSAVNFQGDSTTFGSITLDTLSGSSSNINFHGSNVKFNVSSFTVTSPTQLTGTGGTITVESDSSHALTVGGTTLNVLNDALHLVSANNSVTFQDGLNLTVSGGALLIASPQIIVHDTSGGPDVTLSATSITLEAQTNQLGTITFSSTGNQAAFDFGSTNGTFITANSVDLGGMRFFNDAGGLTINSASGQELDIIGSGGVIVGDVTLSSNVMIALSGGLILDTSHGFVTIDTPVLQAGIAGQANGPVAIVNSDTGFLLQNSNGNSFGFQTCISSTQNLQTGTIEFGGADTSITVTNEFDIGPRFVGGTDHSFQIHSTQPDLLVRWSATSSSLSGGTVSIEASDSIAISGGSQIDTDNLVLQTPVLQLGASGQTGTQTVTFSTNVLLETSPAGSETILPVAGATNAQLHLVGPGDQFSVIGSTVSISNTDINAPGGINIASPNGQSLVLTASGSSLSAQAGLNFGTVTISSDTGINLDDGLSIAVTGSLSLQSPQITIGQAGQTGALASTFNVSNGSISLSDFNTNSGRLTLFTVAGATSGSLNLNGAAVTSTSAMFSIQTGTTISSDHAISITAPTGTVLSLSNSPSCLTCTALNGSFTSAVSTSFISDTEIHISDGTNLTINSALLLQSPLIQVGETGDVNSSLSVAFTTTAGTTTIQGDAGGSTGIRITNLSNTSGTLTLNGADVAIKTTSFLELGPTLSSDHNLSINSPSGQGLFVFFSSDAINAPTTIGSDTQLNVANLSGLTVAGSLALQSPNIIVGQAGDTGSLNATFTATGGINIQAGTVQNGDLVFAPVAGSDHATLFLNGSNVTTVSRSFAQETGLNGSLDIRSDSIISVTAPAGQTLTLSTPLCLGCTTLFPTSIGGSNLFSVLFRSDTAIILKNGYSTTVHSRLFIESPIIQIGGPGDGTGSQMATFTPFNGLPFTIQSNGSGNSSLTIQTLGGAMNGTLNMTSASTDVEGANITIAANTTLFANTGGFNVSQTGSVSTAQGALISAAAITLGNASHLYAGSIDNPLMVSTPFMSFSGQGTMILNDSEAVSIRTNIFHGAMNFTDPVSIALNGNGTAQGQAVFTTSLFNVAGQNFTVTGSNPNIVIQSPSGSNLTISGGGNLTATNSIGNPPADGTIIISSPQNNVVISGNLGIRAQSETIIAASGAVDVTNGTVGSNGNLEVVSNTFLGSTSNVVANSGTKVLSLITVGASMGTIVNPNGDEVLTAGMLINTFGKPLAILASGNVYSTGVPTINLSSSSGNGGSLTVMAGVNFFPQISSTTSGNTNTTFTLLGASSTGGNINLASTNIITSSTALSSSSNKDAGSVSMGAFGGSVNSGSVYIASITATSANGNGGTVTLFGAGGVQTGNIQTNGAKSGGAVNIAGATPPAPLLVFDGLLIPVNGYAAMTPTVTAGSGAAVKTGYITTTSTAGAGGAVRIVAENDLSVGSIVTTTGLTGGGSVFFSTLNGALSVSSTLTTSAANILSGTTNAGSAGDVTINAPAIINLGGSVVANGGSTTAGTTGGDAGVISITTSSNNNNNGLFEGNISIAGGLSAAGGNGKTNGGAGKDITVTAASLQIKGLVTAPDGDQGSVVNSGGKGSGTSVGAAGNISMTTYCVQYRETDFDFLNGNQNLVAMPGGIFTIAGGTTVSNGTAFKVVSGANKLTSGTVTTNNSTPIGNGSISVHAGASGSATELLSEGGGTNNVQVTPGSHISNGEGWALYQVSFGLSSGQTVNLNSSHQVSGAAGNGSILTLPEYDVPTPGKFNLSAAGTIGAVTLFITGLTPKLDLSHATSIEINGFLDFSSSGNTALFNAGIQSFSMGQVGGVSSVGTLVLQSTGVGGIWTNNGAFSAGNSVVLLNPAGGFNLTNTALGIIGGSSIQVPANGMPATLRFTNADDPSSIIPINIQALQLPTSFGSVAATLATGSVQPTSSTLILTAGGTSNPIQLGGTLTSSFANLVVSAPKNSTLQPTNLDLSNASFTTSLALNVNASGSLTLNNSTLSSGNLGTSITATGIAVTNTTVSASGNVVLNTLTGGLTTSGATVSSTLGSVSVTSNNSSTGLNLGATNTVSGARGVSVRNLGGAVSLGSLTGTASSFSSSLGQVSITSTGALSATDVNFNAAAGIIENSNTSVSNSGSETINSTGGYIFLTAPGGVSIANGSVLGAPQVFLSAGTGAGGISLGSVNITGSTAVSLTSGSTITIGSGTITSSNQNVTISGASGVTLTSTHVNGKLGISIADGASGGLALHTANLSSGAGSVSLTNNNTSLLTFDGTGTILASTNVSISSTRGSIVVGQFADSLNHITATNGSFTMNSHTDITDKRLHVVAKGSITVNAGGQISEANTSNFTSTAGSFSVTASSMTLSQGDTDRGATGVFLRASGDLTAAAGLDGDAINAPISVISTGGNVTVRDLGPNTNKRPLLTVSAAKDITIPSFTDMTGTSLTVTAGGKISDGGTAYDLTGGLTMTAAKSIQFGVGFGSYMAAGTGVSLSANNGSVTTNNHGDFIIATQGTVSLKATGGIVDLTGATVQAGSLAAGAPTGLLLNSNISKTGSISIISNANTTASGGLNLANTSLTASGTTASPGNITVLIAGDATISSGVSMQANGGNLKLLATGNIQSSGSTVTTNDQFGATGVATSSTAGAPNFGGGIEFSGGSQTSQLATAVNLPKGTVPSQLNVLTGGSASTTNLVINNPTSGADTSGVVKANITATGAGVNLTNSNADLTTLNLKGGAIVFDSTANKSVKLNGATFTVYAYKPIGYETDSGEDATELAYDNNDEVQCTGNKLLALLLVPGETGLQKLIAADETTVSEKRNVKAGTEIDLVSGQLFINALRQTHITTQFGAVTVKRGALVSISVEHGTLRVATLSGPGDVSVRASGHDVSLLPGEELMVGTADVLTSAYQADGVGRRNLRMLPLDGNAKAAICEVSIVSMMANLPHLRNLAHPKSATEKRISDRLLKTAAALQQITAAKGAYTARPAARPAPAHSDNLVPVGYALP